MILVIGGAFQGKLDYVLNSYGVSPAEVGDAYEFSPEEIKKYRVINKFHLTIKKIYETGLDLDKFLQDIYMPGAYKILICDEIGLGVVPEDKVMRDLRDFIGKALIKTAAASCEVVRVTCGLPLMLKGTL